MRGERYCENIGRVLLGPGDHPSFSTYLFRAFNRCATRNKLPSIPITYCPPARYMQLRQQFRVGFDKMRSIFIYDTRQVITPQYCLWSSRMRVRMLSLPRLKLQSGKMILISGILVRDNETQIRYMRLIGRTETTYCFARAILADDRAHFVYWMNANQVH